MKVLKGKPVSDYIISKLRPEIDALATANIVPNLAIIRVGEREEDILYEKGIQRKFEANGAKTSSYLLDKNVTQQALSDTITMLNNEQSIHGIIILKPLHPGINAYEISQQISVSKDVDGVTVASLGATMAQRAIGFSPCTATACVEILDFYKIPIVGENITVIGSSLVVGMPLSIMLMNREATVTTCNTMTQNLPEICRKSKVIISAAGAARLVTRDFMNAEQYIVDVGINVDADGVLCGDVDWSDAEMVRGASPVPGGVGVVTTTCILRNTVEAARRINNL